MLWVWLQVALNPGHLNCIGMAGHCLIDAKLDGGYTGSWTRTPGGSEEDMPDQQREDNVL